MSSNVRGRLLLMVGPSGVGKGTVVNMLKARHSDWVFPVSSTTRTPRPGEEDCKDYYFFTPEQFDKKIADDEFLEWAWVHGKQRYGLLKSSVLPHLDEGKIVVRDIDIQGCEAIQSQLPPRDVISFFLLPPSREILIERITSRAPISEAELERRLESMAMEIERGKNCDHQIQTINNRPELSVEEIERIVEESG